MQHTVYLFDGFQLDVTRRKLLSSGGLVLPLNSRAMEALLLLVANAGQVIDRRRLMGTVWPDTIVEDNNLNQCILAIRKALGEAAGSNRFVMTVQGRGFCFVCPVHAKVQESSHDDPVTPLQAPAPGSTPDAAAARSHAAERKQTSGTTAKMKADDSPRPPGVQRSFWWGMAVGAALVAVVLLPFALH